MNSQDKISDETKEKLKGFFGDRLKLLCTETKEATGKYPSRLNDILQGVHGEWFSQITALVENRKIKGIEYLFNEKTGESFFNLTIEAIVLENRDYRQLFSKEAIEACKYKLAELEYKIETP